MSRPLHVCACLFVLWTLSARLCAFEEAEKGVYVESFDEGALLDWEHEEGVVVELMNKGGESLLHVGRAGEVTLSAMEFTRFSLGVDIQGGGGVRVAGRYTVQLGTAQNGVLLVFDRKKKLIEIPFGVRNKRFKAAARTHRLEIVCAGSLLRVAMNGEHVFEKADAKLKKASITLVAGTTGSLFDNLRIETTISPKEGAVARPQVAGDALVFSSKQDAKLPLKVANYSAEALDLVAAVVPFDAQPYAAPKRGKKPLPGPVVEFGVNHFYKIHTRGNEAVASKKVAVKAGARQAVELDLGKVPAGFYMLDLAFHKGAKPQNSRLYPFAVFEDTAPVEYEPPVIPVGAYTHFVIRRNKPSVDPLWTQTYLHYIALDLKRHHFTAVVACGGFPAPTVEIFNRYGIAVLERGEQCLDHPGVLGALIGDEPKPADLEHYKSEYAALRKKTDKPLITCCVGEGIGMGDKHWFWSSIHPPIRAFRWYGVKKSFYGIQHQLRYKGVLPFADILRVADVSFETPYWVVVPSFGGSDHEAYFQFPSPGQMRGMMHLSLAYGARGVLLWTYQRGDKHGGMVDPVTKRPRGETWSAAGAVAAKVKQHAKLLATLRNGKLDVRCVSPHIEVVALHDGADGRYAYVINKNTRKAVSCRVFWPKALGRGRVRDIYADKDLTPQASELHLSVPLELAPGDGTLLSVGKGSADG